MVVGRIDRIKMRMEWKRRVNERLEERKMENVSQTACSRSLLCSILLFLVKPSMLEMVPVSWE
jgi:hypothetical protein